MYSVKVSIIIPLLNSDAYLEECLHSVCQQSLLDIEIICVDSGSTDSSLDIIKQFQKSDSRIKLLTCLTQSYGDQVNLGIHNAQGGYIGIVESDDYISPDFYQHLYKKIVPSQPDFVKSGFTQFGTIHEKKYFEKVIRKHTFANQTIDLQKYPSYRLFDPVHIWSAIYRKDFLTGKNIWLNPTPGASFQDTSFSLLVGLLAKHCIYTTDADYFYRIDNIASSGRSHSKTLCMIDEYSYLYAKLREMPLSAELLHEVKAYQLTSYFWNFRRMDTEGRLLFLQAIHSDMCTMLNSPETWSPSNIAVLNYLADLNGASKFAQKESELEKDYLHFLSLVKNKSNNKIVLVLTNKSGKNVFVLQQKFSCHWIDFICSNQPSMNGILLDDRKVQSLKNCVENHPQADYLVISKKGKNEIFKTLTHLGISQSHIHLVSYLPSFLWMIEHFK